MLRTTTFLAVAFAFLLGGGLQAQDLQRLAIENLQTKHADLGLDAADVSELRLSHQYASRNGVEHLTIQQYYNNVPVFNGLAGMHYKNGRLVFRTSNLYHGLAARPVSVPTVSVLEALYAAARPMDVTTSSRPAATGQADGKYTFSWPQIARGPITAELVMVPHQNELLVSWQFNIDQVNTPDVWLAQVDAVKGTLITRHNQTLYCNFNGVGHRHDKAHATHACAADNAKNTLNSALPLHEAMVEATLVDGARYNVFPFGLEAPIFGEREMVVSPADPVSSPFGWHDTNGQDGPEYTTTRGNNVFAYLDRDNNDSPDTDIVSDGGDSLVFDYFYANGAGADTIAQAAMAQLFYMTNMVHGFTYAHGFDEAAGNFQQNNYGNGGSGGDPIRAEAQDGGGTNNANFSTPADGSSGRMQMYLWENIPSGVTVNSPSSVAGSYNSGSANFGPEERPEPITGDLVVAVDGTNMPQLACEAIVNGAEVSGKVAMITRGECFFEEKTLNAQAVGAIAVIICNVSNEVITMAGGVDNDEPTIPTAMLSSSDCAALRVAMANGPVSITFPALVATEAVDGDFDNGIVAHEIGHGISNRLVGGPNNTSCLGNGEQMGEGWSDFFSLATSPINGAATMPNGTEARGIGNFATERGVNGGGIRSRPYSTDMNINPYTYDRAILVDGIHQLGEVWATTLWDLYWAMVEDHGFDEDLINGSGGNNIAVQLVIEGLKFTSCAPGMLDGRDGILAADEIVFDGANTCRIWEVFARRGMGFSATQGSSMARTDGREAFDVNPSCIPTVKVIKTADQLTIEPGQEVTFTITVRNDKPSAATEIVVTDEIPEGMTFIPASVNGVESFLAGAGQVIFNVGDLPPGEREIFTYTVSTATDIFSTGSFFDGAEGDDENWIIEPLNGEGTFIWEQTENGVYDGDFAWFVANAPENSDQIMQSVEPFQLIGSQPAVRFFTNYDIEPGWDGGLVEMSTDGTNWTNVGNERLIRGKYRGRVQASAFDASVTDLNSYWGESEGYFDVYIDLADLAGQEVYLRWRFGADANNGDLDFAGWWVDNIQLIDMKAYNMTTTLTSATNDNASTILTDGGVIVEVSGETVDVVDPNLGLTSVKVFPNPASEFLKVYVRNELGGQATVQLIGIDGRMVAQQSIELLSGGKTVEFNTANLPAGIYLVQVMGADRIHTEKVTIQ